MGSPGDPVEIETLLAHRDWVRRVARTLVLDEARAADLEQEVWLRALTKPPREDRGLRGWLATVLRNTAWNDRRSEERRGRREAEVPPPGSAPSPADLVAAAETHERVVKAVLALEEPFRAAILLRWFEDLPPTEMARRLGIPVDTVKSRLRRAQERLRERLTAEEDGDPRRWMALLLPLARAAGSMPRETPPPPRAGGPPASAAAPTVLAGGIAMALKSNVAAGAVAAAALLLLAGGAGWILLGREGEDSEAPPPGSPPLASHPTPRAAPEPSTPNMEGGIPLAESAHLLEITVTDLSGTPLPGATATLHRHPRKEIVAGLFDLAFAPPSPTPPLRSAIADAGGRCAIPVPETGEVAILVRAPAFAAWARTFVLAAGVGGTTVVHAVLEPACTLEGIVLDALGLPVEGAEVGARNQRPPAEPPWNGGSATTKADGRFRIEGLPPVAQSLTVRRGSLAWASWTAWLPHERSLTIRLPAGGMAVAGNVLDAATGEPVAGASVGIAVETFEPQPLAMGPAGPAARAGAVTGGDGTFRIEGLPHGRLSHATCRAEGYLPWPDPLRTPPVPNPVPTECTAALYIRMVRGGVVTGTVTDPEGKPVGGANVVTWSRVEATGRFGSTDTVVSGPDGTYRSGPVPPGEAVLLVHPAPPWRGLHQEGLPIFLYDFPGPPHVFTVAAGVEALHDVRLARGSGTVEGTVFDDAGMPVAGASVGVQFGPGFFGGGGLPATSAPDGTFRVEAVAPGKGLRVWGSLPGGGTGSSSPFDLEEGGTAGGQVVVLLPTITLAGRVTRSDGAPVRGAALYLLAGGDGGQALWSALDRLSPLPVLADGTFRIEGVRSGPWILAATAEGCAPAWSGLIQPSGRGTPKGVIVMDGREDLSLVLEPAAPLRGRVRDPAGMPVAGARVWAERAGTFEGPGGGFPPSVTGVDGGFILEGLPAGPVRLHVRREGETTVDAVAGGEDVEVTLPVFAPIEGRILEADGGPARGPVQVEVRVGENGPWWSGAAAADGSFASIPLDASAIYRVRATRSGGMEVAYRRDVAAGTRDLEVRFPRLEDAVLLVLDEEGNRVTVQALALAEDADPLNPYRRLLRMPDATGAVRFTGDATLTYRVGAGGCGSEWQPRMAEGTLRPGGPPAELRLRRGVAIAGTLRDPAGNPLKEVSVRVDLDGIPSELDPVATTDGNGAFTLRGLPPGPVHLRAWIQERNASVNLGVFTAPADAVSLMAE